MMNYSSIAKFLFLWAIGLGTSLAVGEHPPQRYQTGVPAAHVEPDEGAAYYDEGEVFSDDSCSDCLAVPEALAGPCWSAGIQFTLLRPHFESNIAFTTLESDGDTTDTFTDTEFMFQRELAPRVWIEALTSDALGFRAVYWQYDHPADTAVGQPPENGFGRIIPPDFGQVDLSTTVPGSQFTALSDLNAYTIDLELTKALQWGRCGWLTGFGLRYADVQQAYRGELRNEDDAVQGTVNFSHHVKGIGPTIAVLTNRPLTQRLNLFGMARGALVFGDGESAFNAIEDQDLDDQLTTRRITSRHDLLPIGEMQVGFQWAPGGMGVWQPYLHLAMEGQLWSSVGNASSEDGNLGFYGFNVALGFDF